MALAYLGLGSNVGDRRAHLDAALERLTRLPDTVLEAVSAVREYPPVGGPPQGPYLNAVAALATRSPARDLVRHLHEIEEALGRRRPDAIRWGPRVIDLDLLLYDDMVLKDPDCTIPHPRLHERRFVLEPLTEIAPQAYHPVLRCTAAALLHNIATSNK